MKKLVFVGFMVAWLSLGSQTAYAWSIGSVATLPVIAQVVNVVKCVVADSGKITASLVTHAQGFAVETLETVGQCLIYTARQATGVGDPNTLHEEPHE